MKFHPLPLPGAWLIELAPVRDDRGFFVRWFCAQTFASHGLPDRFVQANHSQSLRKGTIRGLHYQVPPAAEAKLVCCIRGSVQDVLVDVRRGSPTFLQWHGQLLREGDFRLVYVPPGIAHGYQALENQAAVMYQTTAPYTPALEARIRFDEPRVGIAWQVGEVIVSDKDATTPLLTNDFRGVDLCAAP
jgi:dTDP-4-dehydrorhamnose 3,5-epimerase